VITAVATYSPRMVRLTDINDHEARKFGCYVGIIPGDGDPHGRAPSISRPAPHQFQVQVHRVRRGPKDQAQSCGHGADATGSTTQSGRRVVRRRDECNAGFFVLKIPVSSVEWGGHRFHKKFRSKTCWASYSFLSR